MNILKKEMFEVKQMDVKIDLGKEMLRSDCDDCHKKRFRVGFLNVN